MAMSSAETEAAVREAAKRAAAGVKLYVVMLEPIKGANHDTHKTEHFRFVEELDRKGIIFASGPMIDDKTEESDGGSMYILRASSLAEAEAIARQEPWVIGGAKTITVRPWRFATGEAIHVARRSR